MTWLILWAIVSTALLIIIMYSAWHSKDELETQRTAAAAQVQRRVDKAYRLGYDHGWRDAIQQETQWGSDT